MNSARFRPGQNAICRHGFTLVELLTVIAIIGILAGILIPVIGKVQERSRTATCLSNLRQMGVAIGSYAADNKGMLPVNDQSRTDSGLRWYLLLNPYVDRAMTDWAEPSIFICKSNDPAPDNTSIYKIWTNYGYRCNVALMPVKQTSTGSWYPYPPVSLNTMNSKRILVADAGSVPSLYLTQSSSEMPYQGNMERARSHNGGANILMSDFSVSWMRAEDLVSENGRKLSWY